MNKIDKKILELELYIMKLEEEEMDPQLSKDQLKYLRNVKYEEQNGN